jgi:hypothetical protein
MATFRITRVWPGRTAYRAHLTSDGQPAVDSALVAEHVEGQLYCSPVQCSAGGGPLCSRDATSMPVEGTGVSAEEALRALAERLKAEQESLRRRALDMRTTIECVEAAASAELERTG